jgi:hypothetical protein
VAKLKRAFKADLILTNVDSVLGRRCEVGEPTIWNEKLI